VSPLLRCALIGGAIFAAIQPLYFYVEFFWPSLF